MNSIHNNGDSDKPLDKGLHKLGREYGLLDRDEPPELLDQAILNSAHRAVEKKPHWMKFGWLHGLTTAAVFVLAFSIILDQRETAPEYESGVRDNAPARLQRERAAKKESASELNEMRMEMKVKSDSRQDTLQNIPAAAPLESALEEVQDSPYVSSKMQGEVISADKDVAGDALMFEEVFTDEADLTVDSLESGILSKQTLPVATVAEPTAAEEHQLRSTLTVAEQKLQAIIKLKQSGDEAWKTELKLFKDSYPDYPLPEELKN